MDIENLRKSEERFRLGLETGALAGVWDWDIQTGEVFWSTGLERIHGFSPGTFPGTFEAVVQEIHPDDRDLVTESIRNAVEQNSDHNVEYRILRPDGSMRWVMGRGRTHCDENGRPQRMVGICMDITERKQAEEALRVSNLKFRAVIEAANDAILLTDSSGNIVLFNDAAEKIFGCGQELIGAPVTVLVAERYRKACWEGIRRLKESGEQRIPDKTTEMYGIKTNGAEFPVEISLAACKVGKDYFFSAAIRDISKRKQAEASLKRNIDLVQLLQDVAVASNESGTVESKLQFALDRICAFTGWQVGHVYLVPRDNPNETYPSKIWHLDDPERFKSFKEVTEETVFTSGIGLPGRVLTSGECAWIADISSSTYFQRISQASDTGVKAAFAFPATIGSEVVAILEFFTLGALPVDQELLDEMRHVGAILGRAFERQRSLEMLTRAELQYRQLVESVQAIVWRGDVKSLQFSFVSPEAEVILGYPVRQWIEEPNFWADHIHPEDRDFVISFCRKSALEKEHYDFEYRMIAQDGKTIWLRDFVRVLPVNGQPHDLIGVMIDITRQKEAEERLKRVGERLRSLSEHLQYVREQERTKIAREIHDELGQVLTALKMDLALLNHKLLEASEIMPRRKLMKEIGAMSDLVDRTIQSVKRIATELRPEVLDHLDLIGAIEWQTQEFQARSGIACHFNSDANLLDLTRDSATALFRIFQETLTNIARHSSASHVNIKMERQGDQLIMQVEDNGRGITEAEIVNAKSFGLMGIRERALILGGEVDITGGPGQGTTVTVRVGLTKQHPGKQ